MIFNLTSHVTVSARTKVIADTIDEAISISKERDVVLGGIGSGADENEEWIIEYADGSPLEIRAE